MIKIIQTNTYTKKQKKLHANQKTRIDKEVAKIRNNPFIGQSKKGKLNDVRVHKFTVNAQTMLLAYSYDEQAKVITLLAIGSHENFYRDLGHTAGR